MTEQAGSEAICLASNTIPKDGECPKGREECLREECEEYQVVYSG